MMRRSLGVSVALGCLLLGVPALPAASAAGEAAQRAAIAAAEAQLSAAREQHAAARQRLAALRARLERVTHVVAAAREDLGTLARAAYTSESSELIGLALLIGTDDPEHALHEATVAELVAGHQHDQWQAASAVLQRVAGLHDEAVAEVEQSQERVGEAEAGLIRAQNTSSFPEAGSGGAGTTALAELCSTATRVVDICQAPPWSEANLTLDAVVVERYVATAWPQIEVVGGWRPSDPYPDHPSGRAVDIMMPDSGTTSADVALGNEISAYFQEHAAEYGIYYMIWRQRTWRSGDPIGQWSGMSDRGSPTANHMDHVHITVSTGTAGVMAQRLVADAS